MSEELTEEERQALAAMNRVIAGLDELMQGDPEMLVAACGSMLQSAIGRMPPGERSSCAAACAEKLLDEFSPTWRRRQRQGRRTH